MTKDKEARISTSNHTKNSLITSNTRDSDDVIKSFKFWIDFVPEYHHAKFGDSWTTNKGETLGGGGEGFVPPQPEYD